MRGPLLITIKCSPQLTIIRRGPHLIIIKLGTLIIVIKRGPHLTAIKVVDVSADWTTLSVRRSVRERLELLAKRRGLRSPGDAVGLLLDIYDLATASERLSRLEEAISRLEERISQLDERLSWVEDEVVELACRAPAPPTPPPLAQAAEERREERREPKKGVFKVITTKWIRERAKKEVEAFLEEWRRMGCEALLLPGGDRALVVSDDVVEEVVGKLNELKARGPSSLQGLEDKALRERALSLSAAGLIYYDAAREEWRRA